VSDGLVGVSISCGSCEKNQMIRNGLTDGYCAPQLALVPAHMEEMFAHEGVRLLHLVQRPSVLQSLLYLSLWKYIVGVSSLLHNGSPLVSLSDIVRTEMWGKLDHIITWNERSASSIVFS